MAAYALAGWSGIFPVPVIGKTPPPTGVTGADGRDADTQQLVAWSGSHAEQSIAVRMPDGVIGIDVDHYDKGSVAKRGGDTLAAHEAKWGLLPPTWRSSARELPSGIRFYRTPAGRYATHLGDDIEIIQRHHRYAVVWPSLNPDAAGAAYLWYDPSGALSDSVPKPNELPELPEAWVTGLREGATEAGPAAADWSSGQGLLSVLLADQREPCAEVTDAMRKAATELESATSGGRHDAATARAHHLVQMGAAGHPGVAYAVDDLRARWEALTAGEGREDEFNRMLLTSARKAVTVVGPRPVDRDPCFSGGEMWAPPAPGGNGVLPPPVAAPIPWSVRQVIGAHTFDPQADLDHGISAVVLHRMWPVLRYAVDAGDWLLRGPDRWEVRGDLTRWAVHDLAELMPRGDPDAEKGSELQRQAARRARLMMTAGRNGVASTMTAAVAAGTHPCALKLSQLDSDAGILWAGGVPWDMRASTERPVPAWIDPGTPHLHSAAITPADMPTPLWDRFLVAVWPDPEVRAWALRVLAIAFTGVPDAALPILLGPERRGKSQVIHLLMSVLGSYALSADPRLLGNGDNAHASIVYALMGRRLAFIDEGPREGRWAQERLKQLTGGTALTGNEMRSNPVTFNPSHTLVLTANDEPPLTDPAVRARVRLIPCEGDEAEVRAARRAIGATDGAYWLAEAPGVLWQMIREAGRWYDDPDSAMTAAAPEHIRNRADLIAAEQDVVAQWVSEACEPYEPGTNAGALHEAFVGWCRNNGFKDSARPTTTKWGRRLNDLGYPREHRRDGWYRQLRVTPPGGYPTPYLPTPPAAASQPPATPPPATAACDRLGDRLVTGSSDNRSQVENAAQGTLSDRSVTGVTSSLLYTAQHHTPHTYIEIPRETGDHSQPVTTTPQKVAPEQGEQGSVTGLENWSQGELPVTDPPEPTRRADPATGRYTKAAQKAAEKEAARQAAAGETVPLPALVDRSGAITAIDAARAGSEVALAATRAGGAITVDVETSGFPIGHADYALRTVQLGDEQRAVVLDPADPEQADVVRAVLAGTPVLHAHSATADLVPLAAAGLTDESAWERMHDTVIPAKLADPQSTGSDPGLKQLAEAVLNGSATAPAADAARGAMFKVNGWLKDVKATTPIERNGWAQVDSTCSTMIRYAASDVLDTAALATRLPQLPAAVVERERAVQRITARVAHRGVRVDRDQVARLEAEHQPAMEAAAVTVRAFGVDNPGSDRQLADRLTQLGVTLPRTPSSTKFPNGQASVAAGVLEGFRGAPEPAGGLIAAVLDYRHHETVLSTFLEPYRVLCERGDGRARPTVYTLGTDTGRMSCVQSDALIEMPRDLAKYPGGVPITEVKAGDWVYAFDHHRELVLRRVKWCEQTGVRQTMTITAENSDGRRITLRATPEHLIRLYNGDWRATEGLLHSPGRPHREDGPRLMTMVRRFIDDGYVKFYPHANAKGNGPNGGGKSREHRWVVEQTTGRRLSTKVDVDHIDGNKVNNHPDNLRPLPMQEHRGNRELARGVAQPFVDLPAGSNDFRVLSVEPGLVEPVWDMEVEGVHNFVANGICVHNCVRPNLQQLPREGGVRACITADPGHVLVSADFSGVEIRVMAALSQDPELIRQLREGVDLHAMVAKLAFGPGWTKSNRYTAKRGVFGWAYGGSVPSLARQLGVSEQIMQAIVDALRKIAPAYVAWADEVKRQVRTGATQMPTYAGRVIHLDRQLPHKAPNYCIQGTARELLVDALLAWEQTRWGGGVVLPVHDEIVAMVPEQDAEEATAELVCCMSRELYGIPIVAEPSEPSFAWRDSA